MERPGFRGRFERWLWDDRVLGLRLDLDRAGIPEEAVERLRPLLDAALAAMQRLEGGAIANPDERRMVGHYWLRTPHLAPQPELRAAIEGTVRDVRELAARVHRGELRPPSAARFDRLLVVGIGGSALGPQLVADALGRPGDRMQPHFLDNTDPDGFDRVLGGLGPALASTLVVVISKSGGTPETRNGMLETEAAFAARGLALGPQAVAITQEGSRLDGYARERGFLARLPMWDWVGGRTSVLSAVGLLPAALQGIEVGALLEGAARMDEVTRARDLRANPALLLALAWHWLGGGHGRRDMVVLPYKDRLALFSRYLQQLVMESLGKEHDLEGRVVHQGLAVYGNKGSTDQHAYVQQLRDGLANFFVTFIGVLRDRDGASGIEVDEGVRSGDYLHGFLLGTRQALHERGRPSITITLDEVAPRSIGALIAVYERAVGFYASLIGVNAYHQPGVEAGKRAAAELLALQRKLVAKLREGGPPRTAEELAAAVGAPDEAEHAWHLLEHLAANPDRGVERIAGQSPLDARYRTVGVKSGSV